MINLHSILGYLNVFDHIIESSESDTIDCSRYGAFDLQICLFEYVNGYWNIKLTGSAVCGHGYGDIMISSVKKDGEWEKVSIGNLSENGAKNFGFDRISNYIKVEATKVGSSGIICVCLVPKVI